MSYEIETTSKRTDDRILIDPFDGSRVSCMRYLSTSTAAPRPSAIPQLVSRSISVRIRVVEMRIEGRLNENVHNERLTSTSVSSSEDSLDVGVVLAVRRFDVGATILFETQRLDRSLLRTEESQSENDAVASEESARER